MEKPIQFVTTKKDGRGFEINPEAVRILQNCDKHLVVVAVVGLFRTGKSFLLNLLMDRMDGFPLGPTTQAETKGIWMWMRDHPNDSSRSLLLLDTEGLHDPENGNATHDAHIFTLAILLSNVLVYNSMGTIDANALEGLRLSTELTQHIRVKADDSEELGLGFSHHFPTLIWTVRDFFLQLAANDQQITPDEYLESCLTQRRVPYNDKAGREYNNLKAAIREFFRTRHCFVFPRPTSDDNLTKMEQLQLTDLDVRFQETAKDFYGFIIARSPVKYINGKPLTGPQYVALAQGYVKSINEGQICIESTYNYLIRNENGNAIQKAVETYIEIMMNSVDFPVSVEKLNEFDNHAQLKANEVFLANAIQSDESIEYSKQLIAKLEAEHGKFVQRNLTVSSEFCENVLTGLFADMKAKLDDNSYLRPGGSELLKKDIEELREEYESVPEETKGPANLRVLTHFMTNKITPILTSVLQADEALSRAEAERETMEIQKESAELAKAALEDELKKQKLYLEEIQKSMGEKLKAQEEEFLRQINVENEKMQQEMSELFMDKERMIRDGFEEEAKLLQKELDRTMKQLEDQQKNHYDLYLGLKEEMDQKLMVQQEAHEREIRSIMEKMSEPGKKGRGFWNYLGDALTLGAKIAIPLIFKIPL